MKFLYIEDGALTAAQWLRFAALQESGSGTLYGPAVPLQAECDDLEMIGLALLYPALERSSIAPGHHGYPRAPDLILGKALEGR